MTKEIWISLSAADRAIVRKALARFRGKSTSEGAAARSVLQKLNSSSPYPKITVGVHGGQVQWALGNPFPVRVCDYDGDERDLPNVDERNQRCRIWFEPVDAEAV